MKPSYPFNRVWKPAHRSNYTPGANKPERIVVHVIQGSWASALNWFQNPAANVSCHFAVASDGSVGQSLGDYAAGYHAGNWGWNKSSLGIEHGGYVDQPAYFTDAMLHASARLVAYKCKQYGIPVDRKHIVAHSQIPGTTHTDPGAHWPWARYMALVKQYRFGEASKAAGASKPSGPASDTVYRVIAGSFSDRSGANTRARQMQNAGFPEPWIYQHGQYFRVQAASYSDEGNADEMVQRLKAAGIEAYALAEKA